MENAGSSFNKGALDCRHLLIKNYFRTDKFSVYNGSESRNRVSDSNRNEGIILSLYVNDQDTFLHAHNGSHNYIHVYDEIDLSVCDDFGSKIYDDGCGCTCSGYIAGTAGVLNFFRNCGCNH